MSSVKQSSPLYKSVDKGSYRDLMCFLGDFGDGWAFRGQGAKETLTTTLERECMKSGLSLEGDAEGVEDNMMRRFRRVYYGEHQEEVKSDTLYCLSVMRHYGAPTRLLDFTYSQYVATYFALEAAYNDVPEGAGCSNDSVERTCAIWCIRVTNLNNKVKGKYQEDNEVEKLIEARGEDITRNDKSFRPLYMEKKYNFVLADNPLLLHRRLHLQQGVHLCPGNVRNGFMHNLLFPYSRVETDDIVKVTCRFSQRDLQAALEQHWRMSVTRESLFPGLDGLAQSMKYEMWLHKKSVGWRKGRETCPTDNNGVERGKSE
ncbi:MAG: FRG domain-containing protein [Chloroflexi bacterium]|nr:FRG domain-containing protein [Chloroflexota bacterium]